MDVHFEFLLKNLKIWHHYTGTPAWSKLAKYLLFLHMEHLLFSLAEIL